MPHGSDRGIGRITGSCRTFLDELRLHFFYKAAAACREVVPS